MTSLSLIAIVLFFIWLYKLLTPTYRFKRMGDALPGPKAWPLVGNSLLFLEDNHFLRTSWELCKTYGPVTRIWLGKQLFILLADAQDIEVYLEQSSNDYWGFSPTYKSMYEFSRGLCFASSHGSCTSGIRRVSYYTTCTVRPKRFLSNTKHMNKTPTYRLFDSWLGTKGLLTGDEDIWRPHRKMLTPSFHFKILESSLEVMRGNAAVLCEQLQAKVDGEEFDILPYAEKCSLDIISEAAMGVKLESQKLSDCPYLHAIKNMTTIIVKRAATPWLFNELIFRFSSLGRAYYAELKHIKSFVHQIIEERKASLLEEAKSGAHAALMQEKAKPFLYYLLLESNFTDEEIENEVQTFMFAGHDTTMTTIAFCMYALSIHPDVQEKVYQEIQDVLDRDNKQELSYQDYNAELKYLDNVIKETLRMYTTVPIISRMVSEDLPLPSGHTLPKGALANFFLYRLHNDERYFPNPDQFLPERFEKTENIVKYSFIPFSAGARNCIGQKFAMLEMKVIITAMIRKYKFLPPIEVKELIVETGVVLRSLNNTPVRLTLRERVAS